MRFMVISRHWNPCDTSLETVRMAGTCGFPVPNRQAELEFESNRGPWNRKILARNMEYVGETNGAAVA